MTKDTEYGMQGDIEQMQNVQPKVQTDIGLRVLACEIGSHPNEGVGGDVQM